MYDLAISYSRSDEYFAKKIFDALKDEYKVFYDINQYDLLVCRYLHEILYDVFFKQAQFALMIINSDYLKSPHTMWEARNIIARGIEFRDRFFILLDDNICKSEVCRHLFIPENDFLFYERNNAETNFDCFLKILRSRIKAPRP